MRRKIYTVIGVLVLLLIIGSVVVKSRQTTNTVGNTPIQSRTGESPTISWPDQQQGVDLGPAPQEPVAEEPPFYNKIRSGMSKADVTEAAGRDPDNCVKTDPTFGNIEQCTWNGSSNIKSVSVTFDSDHVASKD